jgi:hypothetical protein
MAGIDTLIKIGPIINEAKAIEYLVPLIQKYCKDK